MTATGAAAGVGAAAAVRPVVDALVALPLSGLSVGQLQGWVVAVAPQVARLTGWLRAVESELDVRGDGQVPTEDGAGRSAAGWLAEVRHETPSTVGRDLRVAAALRRLPRVVEAVLDGVLTPEQAAVLSRLVGRIADDELAACQDELVLVAADRDPAQLAAWVRHQIATHCEPAAEAEAECGRARRFLQTRRDADGSVHGRFVLAAEDSEALCTVLEPLARKQGLSDDRSAGQRRADALVEVLEQVLRHGDLPAHGGQRPQLSYVLPADWAAGQVGQARCTACGPRCAEHRPATFADTVAAALPGRPGVPAEQSCAVAAWTGPQTRARIEAVLCEARISRVLLDSDGQVRGLQALRDSVTPAQRRALAARDLGCAVRGCTRPPAMCDAHHLRRRAEDGETTLDNLVLLCRRHHVLWHLGKIGLRDLHVPWHPDATAPPQHHRPPDWVDHLTAVPSAS